MTSKVDQIKVAAAKQFVDHLGSSGERYSAARVEPVQECLVGGRRGGAAAQKGNLADPLVDHVRKACNAKIPTAHHNTITDEKRILRIVEIAKLDRKIEVILVTQHH